MEIKKDGECCVNILIWITLISTVAIEEPEEEEDVCQYPNLDNSHFYDEVF